MKSIPEIFFEHKGKLVDKWSFYINEMDSLFSRYREQKINLLEIGIQNGGSLEIWAKYFLNARNIVGCDIDPKCSELIFDDPRVTVVVGDANLMKEKVSSIAKTYDLIIDDGSHRSGDILKSFSIYFPLLCEGGIYVVEDLHCSYWDDFEGGLYDPYSSMSFLKRLADVINYEHWRSENSSNYILQDFFSRYGFSITSSDLETIHSIEFMNSLCVIKKLSSSKNLLGKRNIVGDQEIVTKDAKQLNGTIIGAMPIKVSHQEEGDKFWLLRKKVKWEKKIQELSETLSDRDRRLNELSETLSDRDRRLNELSETLSDRDRRLNELDHWLISICFRLIKIFKD